MPPAAMVTALEVACHTTSVLESFSIISDADVSLAIECCVPGRTLACKHHSTGDRQYLSSSVKYIILGFLGFFFSFSVTGHLTFCTC